MATVKRNRKEKLGYHSVFYRELPDSSGHCWNVPIWSVTITDTGSHEEALEKALRAFEEKFSCQCWSDEATLVEIDEAVSAPDAPQNLPRTKRILIAAC